jgi:hypothetical protein
MIKLKNILNEQGGSFKDLVDGYMVMKDPVDYTGYGNYNPEVGGFTFSSDDKFATKQYKGSELKLVWRSSTGSGNNKEVKFNVFYHNKDQGVFTFDSFGDWLRKLDLIETNKLIHDKLKQLGYRAEADGKFRYFSKYVGGDAGSIIDSDDQWRINVYDYADGFKIKISHESQYARFDASNESRSIIVDTNNVIQRVKTIQAKIAKNSEIDINQL